jgi:DNA-binding NtrC family response regulator
MTDSLRILLVDDEKNIRQTLMVTLRSWGHEVTPAASASEAIEALKTQPFDFLLTDFRMQGASGIDLLRSAKGVSEPPVAVIMTAYASFENAVNATKEGAYDYLPKPFTNAQLQQLLKRVSEIVALKRENARLRSQSFRMDFFSGHTSPAMVRLEELVSKVAPTDASILLVGESGTGKTELARLIHARSPRASRSFVVVNCATLAETLLESELFGHAKGAFTGAVHEHAGKLELAQHGTVLIDEIGELSPSGQTKLLRFLQDRIVERVGSNQPIPVDARVIAATNRDLEEAVREGIFREDLYFRLNTFECNLVPLRYRREDLPILITRVLREIAASGQSGEPPRIPPPVMKTLIEYSWPGNLRELRNCLERLVLLSRGREIEPGDLPDSIQHGPRFRKGESDRDLLSLEEVERRQIERVLAIENNQERAAQILGITTVTLWRKRKQYGLP